MGSVVLSQVAPALGQHSHHHHMMVGGGLHQNEAPDALMRTSRDRSTSATSSARAAPSADIPPTPHSPTLESRPSQPTPNSTAFSQSNPQDPFVNQPDDTRRPSMTSYQSHNLNQYSRGYDQSGFPLGEPQGLVSSSPSSPRLQPTYRSTRSLGGSEATSPSRIKVKNLSHIQSFASEEFLAKPRIIRPGSGYADPGRQFEISAMPVTDIIEMVAGLLTKITTTNDRQHEHIHRPIHPPEDQSNLNSQANCVLAFHGKNVPSITILSYLSRIHKYCPTTYEVFLSLLVYFDRMTENVNKGFLTDLDRHTSQHTTPSSSEIPKSPMPMDLDLPEKGGETSSSDPHKPQERGAETIRPSTASSAHDFSQFFVVDSYNIHRLVIAGVTCASKFFSDVFYTNSRYAKVGGLPLAELNHLELQFLLLNDFRLSVPVEELEAYGTMLVEFYAREIVAQQQATSTQPRETTGGGLYMRDSNPQQ